MTSTYTEIPFQHALRNELVRHAILQGWLGPLLLLWIGGTTFLLLFWALPILALAWCVIAVSIGILMLFNELTSDEVMRSSLSTSVQRHLGLSALESPFDREQLTRNVETFARIAVGIHAARPQRIRDRYLDRSLNNLYQLLQIQRDAAHKAERASEWELSPEICQDLGAAWQKLEGQALNGATPGSQFATDFAAATREALASMQAALEGRGQPIAPVPTPVAEPGAQPQGSTLNHRERSEMVRMTAEALRGLTSPAVLAGSGLIERLQHTLAAAQAVASESMSSDGFMAPLEKGQLLRRVLVVAIERLRQDSKPERAEQESDQYIVLYHMFVRRKSVREIGRLYGYSDRTVERHREVGIKAVVADLVAREQHLARQAEGVPSRPG